MRFCRRQNLDDDIQKWMAKYEQDMENKSQEIESLKQQRSADLDKFEELVTLYEELLQLVEDDKKMEDESGHQLNGLLHRAAIQIQSKLSLTFHSWNKIVVDHLLIQRKECCVPRDAEAYWYIIVSRFMEACAVKVGMWEKKQIEEKIMTSSTSNNEIEYEGRRFLTIREGSAVILFPDDKSVFYNPVQEFNRDMSVAAITSWGVLRQQEREQRAQRRRTESGSSASAQHLDAPDLAAGRMVSTISVLEALSATGLRSIRYAKEISGFDVRIIANDLDPEAVGAIARNVSYNGLSSDAVQANCGDANSIMHEHRLQRKLFSVVDLDPYGSAAPFLDAAVQSVEDGDLAVLAGSGQTEACWAKYGGVPIPNAPYNHEMVC
ncbi:RNA methyltransferase tRNA(m5U54)methyltransferase [Gonapodya sp. JEL0774]|nr:RNA methyltransferase tRNA(m5U54)methyltransferase [Gonapodya sp. JEL0774]